MAAVKTVDLTKSFGAIQAVDHLSFSVEEGEIFGLVGPDGAGKTTTMRLLTSIMEPTAGDAWVAGHHVVREAEAVKEQIGYMSQRFGLYPDLTVIENLDFYADIYGVPKDGRGERIERLLSFSNMTPFKKRQAGRLSGGMKQKLGLACALIHKPDLISWTSPPTRGSGLAPGLLAHPLPIAARQGDHRGLDGVSGRGGAMRPRRVDAPRQIAGCGDAP